MQKFDEILKRELQKPVALKNGNGMTIDPMEAMVKSVLSNAMKGDLSAISFVRMLTRDSDPEKEMEAQQRHRQRLKEITDGMVAQLESEKIYIGQRMEVEEVAEIKILLEDLNNIISSPDFQPVTTDMKSGHQSVSPVIALRDKQRELFQQQFAKLRDESMRRIFARKNMRI